MTALQFVFIKAKNTSLRAHIKVLAHVCNPSTWEAEERRLLVQVPPGQHNEAQSQFLKGEKGTVSPCGYTHFSLGDHRTDFFSATILV
jgi:hypothetical protein